jgi:hypothetical protein
MRSFHPHYAPRVDSDSDRNEYRNLPYGKEWRRLCGLVARMSGYRSRGLRLDSRRYKLFGLVVDLERDPLIFVRTTEELLELKVAAPV